MGLLSRRPGVAAEARLARESWWSAPVTLFLSPISWSHHWVWVVPALVLLVDRAARTGRRAWWWAATAAAVAYGAWPLSLDRRALGPVGAAATLRSHLARPTRRPAGERHWNLAESLVGNGYLLIGLTVATAVAWHLLGSPAPRPSRQP